MADSTLTFEVYKGSQLVQTTEFDNDSVTIGRADTATLSIRHDSVSDLHAVVNVDDRGKVMLLDLGSEAGVKVNGEQVSNTELSDGDKITVGAIDLVLRTGGAPKPAEDEEDTLVAAQPERSEDPTDAPPPPRSARPKSMATAGGGTTEPAHPVSATPRPTPSSHRVSGGDEEAPEAQVEDVMTFVMRAGTGSSNLGVDRKRPRVLEVSQLWQNTLLDTKHFPQQGKPITVGSSVGYRWNFLGVDMGWVVPPLNTVLKYVPPMWSEVISDWRNDFYTPDDHLHGHQHDLFEWDGEQYVARIHDDWDGFVDKGSERFTFEQLLDSGEAHKEASDLLIPIDDDSRLMVDVDGVVFFSQMVHPGKAVLARTADDVDYPFIAIFSLVGFIGLMFGVLMYTLPPPPQNEMVEIPDRFVELLVEKPTTEQEKKTKPSGNPDAGEGAKAKREEGKVGKKDAKMEKAKGNKREIQKQQRDREIAENAGVLGAMSDAGAMEGSGSPVVDANLTGGIGGVTGAKGVQRGSGGLSSRGSGFGGGGTADGLGGMGTKGDGSGASGYGEGGGNFGAKGEGAIGTVGGDPIILGALDRSLIDEVIKRHMSQIRYCYQRELPKSPTLSGKVVIKFVIAKDGSVSSASTKTTTMNNPAVESCVVGRFMRMQFPKPKGGGIVIVSYPFLFSPG